MKTPQMVRARQRRAIARELGKEAYHKGLPMSQNPYKPEWTVHKDWIRGWMEAEQEARQR
jgi:hypothetical protein